MRFNLSMTFKILSVTSLIVVGISPPTIASHETPHPGSEITTKRKCPFERVAVNAVLAQNTQTEEIVQQPPTEVSPQDEVQPASTEMSAVEIEAVERVRQVYKQICSRPTSVQLPPQQPTTVAPVEQPEPAAVPVEEPAPTPPKQPVRALW
jgi:hypothetical protein